MNVALLCPIRLSLRPSISRVAPSRCGSPLSVGDTGNFHLHAIGQFVGVPASGEIAMFGMPRRVLLVEKLQFVDKTPLMLALLERWRGEVEDRRTFNPQPRP